MEPPCDRFKISQTGKDQLIKLKRVTKIENWNILCRWAFCRSLAESAPPSPVPIANYSNVEMTWQTFGGEMADILIIALKQRCFEEELELDQETLANQFRLQLHRGIGYLSGDPNTKSLEGLINSLINQSG